MEKPNYYFAPTGGGDEAGFNDSVVTTFSSNDKTYHLARESIQNIIDAKDSTVSGPAKAIFSMVYFDRNDLPESMKLREIFTDCAEYEPKNEEALMFYSKAIQKIKKGTPIPVLKISDYNTVGLDENNYTRLLKSVGSSSKSSGAGGSFGLGKGAYFAASNFRTIFVSSVFGNNEFIFQGKLRLSSRKEDNIMLQGNGSYGLIGQTPIKDISQTPNIFRRKEKGTDIFIVDYVYSEDWKGIIIKSVLNNFWLAILKDELAVEVDGVEINKNTLEELLYAKFKIENSDGREELGNPIPYYCAYTDKDAKIFSESLPTLGDVELRLLTNENFPGKVAFFRKTHMLIYKEHPFCPKTYAAVFICENEKGNKLLRSMENPTHDKWSKNSGKTTDATLKRQKTKAEKELKDFVQGVINKIGGSEDEKTLEIPGLENYLYLPGSDDQFDSTDNKGGQFSGEYSNEETASEIGTEEGAPLKVSPPVSLPTTIIKEETGMISSGGEPTDIIISGNGVGGQNPNPITVDIVEGDEKILVPISVKFRSFSIKSRSEFVQIIKIKGPSGKNILLDLMAGTDEGSEQLNIAKAITDEGMPIEINKNKLIGVILDNSGYKTVRVTFESKDKYTITLKAYENK